MCELHLEHFAIESIVKGDAVLDDRPDDLHGAGLFAGMDDGPHFESRSVGLGADVESKWTGSRYLDVRPLAGLRWGRLPLTGGDKPALGIDPEIHRDVLRQHNPANPADRS